MRKEGLLAGRERNRWILAVAMGAGLISTALPVIAQQQPVVLERELKMKVKGPFTVAVVGDLNYVHPVAGLADPDVQHALEIIRDADVAFANMESNIMDMARYSGPITGDPGPKEIAADVKAMGFDIVSRANNHTTEGGAMGMFETNHWLESEGIAHAGSGRNLEEARAAQFVETSKGRVGLVSMASIGSPASSGGSAATYRLGNVGGLPGLNPMRVTMFQIVTPEELAQLRTMRDAAYAHRTEVTNSVPPIPANEPQDRLQLSRVGGWFKAGNTPGGLSFEMNPEDLKQTLRSIRNGKELSDYMIVGIHSHEDDSSLKLLYFSDVPTDFLVELAHKSIDNGADVFVGEGVHVLRGIEIYKGKPIFYGLQSFTYQLNQMVAPLARYMNEGENPFTTEMTDAEANWKYWDSFARPRMIQDNMDSLIGECRYEGGRLVEIRLHPIDMGYNAPLSQQGIPRIPTPENAQRILEKVQRLSKPLGTTIAVEGNIGIIRLSEAQAREQ